MSGPNHLHRSKRGRYSGGSNDDRWAPYPAAHGRHPSAQGFQQYRPQHGPQVQVRSPRIDSALETAYATLLSLIDYSCLPQRPPSQLNGTQLRHEILADSLNYIEVLHNMPLSIGARTNISYFLNKELKRKVPEEYFLNAGVPRERFRINAFVPSPLRVAQAVTARIKDLKFRKERQIKDRTTVKTAKTRSNGVRTRARKNQEDLEEGEIASDGEDDITENQGDEEHAGTSAEDGTDGNETAMSGSTSQQVERFMDKLERWIELWQTGKLQDDDWLSMKYCMDLPD